LLRRLVEEGYNCAVADDGSHGILEARGRFMKKMNERIPSGRGDRRP